MFLTNFEMISEIPGGLLFTEFKRIRAVPDLLKFMKEFRELLVFYFSENLKEFGDISEVLGHLFLREFERTLEIPCFVFE